MEQNSSEQPTTVETEQAEVAAPATKRAPRRATKKAAPAEAAAADAPAADATPAADAAAVDTPAADEAPAEKPKRVSRARKKTTTDEAPAEAPATDAPAAETPAAEAPESEEAPKKPATRRRRATTKTVEAAETTEVTEAAQAGEPAAATAAPAEAATETPAAEEAPAEAPRRRTRRATTTKAKAEAEASESAEAPAEQAPTEEAPTEEAPTEETPKAATRTTRGRRTSAKQAESPKQAESTKQAETAEQTGAATDAPAADATQQDVAKDAAKDTADAAAKGDGASESNDTPAQETSSRRTRSQRNRSRQQQSDSDHGNQQDAEQGSQTSQANQGSGDDKSQASDGDSNRQQQNQQDQQQSRSRTRQRDRKRRGQQNEDLIDPELTEDDVLLPIAGILDVLDNYAFVRTTGYLPGPSDVYVSLGQVKRYQLRKGDAIVGSIRKPSEHDGGGRQKYNAIVKIDSVNGTPLTEDMKRVDFNDLTPLYPQERLRLETTPEKVTQRVIDLIAPIGKGQRGLIVAPPKAGKTIVLQQIANAVAENNPEAHLMVVLVDERPEEVTDMQRTVKGEVIASTFDRPAEDHTTVAELAIERAKRLVELGHDVVVLLDSITRLGRAYNLASPASGRVLTGGVDASALYPPKRFFGAARNIENGGSLTILATALVETGSKADEVIFEEFKGTGNMELRLSRQLADRRIFPAVNLNASSTRREEMLLTPDEVKITWMLRRALGNLSEEQAAELVLSKLRETQSNAEFLLLMQKSQGLS